MQTILVLFGGCSTEYEVSLQSAHGVLSHLDRSRFTPLTVGITREGRWLRYGGPLSGLETGDWASRPDCVPCALSLDRGDRRLLWLDGSGRSEGFDAAFPILHGKNGEDGTVQGLLELMDVPVVGCGALSSALCMDKDRAHKLAALAGVAVPQSAVFHRGADLTEIQAAAESIGWPVFVKPVRAGSSFGISRVENPETLAPAVEEAFRHDDELVLEETIPGFEVGCGVMGNPGGPLTVGAVDEIELAPTDVLFDYTEKYTLRHSAIHCPARIPEETAARIRDAARTVYRALGCRGFARVDLFLTLAGRIVFNEVNTIPGLTSHSRFPAMMKQAGYTFPALLDKLVELGVEG